jgi:TRAP-type C4-dicarboxylate transport system substrate-binding protein
MNFQSGAVVVIGRMLLLALAAIASARLAHADPIKVKLGHFTGDTEETYTGAIKPWADAVNAEAKGVIVIELYPNGALGRNLPQQAQLIDNGVQDIAFLVPGLSPGRFPDDAALALPGLFTDMNESSVVFDNLVTSGKLRGYEGFFPVAEFGTAPFSIHLRKPVNSLEGLRGLKIRAGNAIEAEMLKDLGVAPIVIPVNEIAEGVGRGTIDGTTAQPQTIEQFGIDRVTTYHLMAPLGSAPLAELMSKKVFDGLPKAGQDAIRKYSGPWFVQRYLDAGNPSNERVMSRLRSNPRHQVVDLTSDDKKKWDDTANRVIAAWTTKDPANAKALELVKAEIAKVRSGK